MKIFLSSTAFDLSDFRELVVDRLEKLGHEVIYHERGTFPIHSGYHSHDECILAIEQCDIVLCILDKRYGGEYVGVFQDDFNDQIIKVKGNEGKRYTITIEKKDLSITWCELITAYSKNKDVITFVRQRTLDEKDTRRKNQDVIDFIPAYVERKEIFDLLDWITKQKINNWIIGFNSIVDFEKKLLAWAEEKGKQTITSQMPSATNLEKTENKMKLKLNYKTKNSRDMRICIVVEGETDRYIISNIINKLNIFVQARIDIFTIGESPRIMRNIVNIINGFKNQYEHIIILIDSDTTDINKMNIEIEEFEKIKLITNKENIKMFYAVPQIEAWLLAGINPEEYSKLNGEIWKSDFKNYIKMEKMKYISENLNTRFDFASAMKVSDDFKKFFEYIININE